MKIYLLSIILVVNSLYSLEVDAVVSQAMSTFEVPAIAVGIIQDGKIVHSKGYGLRDLDRKLPVNDKTLFAIGSTTKAFTSYVIDELVKEQVLDWDCPLIDYIPNLQMIDDKITQKVTLRDLITHQTGLPSHDWLLCRSDLSRKDFLNLLPDLKPLHGFRDKMLYNNLMYVIAAIVVEHVTHESLEDHVKKRVFKPLKMKDSNFSIYKTQKKRNHAKPTFNNKHIDFMPLPHVGPAGGIHSNVSEMLLWIQHQLSQKESNCHEIYKEGGFADEPEMDGYALGWKVRDYKNVKLVYHTGVIGGSTCQVMFLPEKNHGIVVLTNNLNGKWAFRAITNTILDQLLESESNDWISYYANNYEKQIDPPTLDQQPKAISSYLGSYSHPTYGNLKVIENQDEMFISYHGFLIPLAQAYKDLFYGSMNHLGLTLPFQFKEDDQGVTAELHVPCIKDHPLVPFQKI